MAKRNATKKRAPKMKRLKKSTGWMKANAVKIERRHGETRVLVRRRQ
jgi:hypothetical protein